MKQRQKSKKIRSHPTKSITKIPLEHSTSHLDEKVKSLLRRLEIGELTDEELNSLDNELKELFVKKIMEINEQKLKQNPQGNEEANEKLLKSAEEGSIVGVLHFLLEGANINTRDNNGWSILHFAVVLGYLNITILGYLNIIKFFAENKYLRNKLDWNAKDNNGRTFLQLAVFWDYPDIIKFFFENKKNFELIKDSVYALDKEGYTILGIAGDMLKDYIINIGYNPFIGEVKGLKEYKERYKELLEKIKTIEDAKKIAKENNFHEDVFIIGISLYFAENCNNNLINFIS